VLDAARRRPADHPQRARQTHLARATPQRIELLAQSQPFDAREVWSTPLLYNGRLYAKGGEEFTYLDVGSRIAAAAPPSRFRCRPAAALPPPRESEYRYSRWI